MKWNEFPFTGRDFDDKVSSKETKMANVDAMFTNRPIACYVLYYQVCLLLIQRAL